MYTEKSIDFEKYNYYKTSKGEIVTVESTGYSYTIKNEEPECFTGSPFTHKSAEELGWKELKKESDFPKWFLNQLPG